MGAHLSNLKEPCKFTERALQTRIQKPYESDPKRAPRVSVQIQFEWVDICRIWILAFWKEPNFLQKEANPFHKALRMRIQSRRPSPKRTLSVPSLFFFFSLFGCSRRRRRVTDRRFALCAFEEAPFRRARRLGLAWRRFRCLLRFV